MNQLPTGVAGNMLLEIEWLAGYSSLAIASSVNWSQVKRFRVYATT